MTDWRLALDLFVKELRKAYGERFDAVLLYGSRARGDAEEGSDVDTLVVLDPAEDFWRSSHGSARSRVAYRWSTMWSSPQSQ